MKLTEVMQELESLGSAQTKKILMRHGAAEPFFGVKVGDLKQIQKKIKRDHELSLELFDTGNADAMYLAGLISEPERLTKTHLKKWARQAKWYMIGEYPVAWSAAESRYGYELAVQWIDAKQDHVAACGWATLAALASVANDDDLDLAGYDDLLKRVETQIQTAGNRARYTMNGFVIAVGAYIEPLLKRAKQVAKRIGKIAVDMGGTACKVPEALPSIEKIESMGRVGRKRKTAKC